MATANNRTAAKKPANVARTAAVTNADDSELPKFPRQMKLVNDTAQPWVIGGTHVEPGSHTEFTARDEDALKRHRTDCHYILQVSDHYKPVEPKEGEAAKPPALRIVEIDGEADEAGDAGEAETEGATA